MYSNFAVDSDLVNHTPESVLEGSLFETAPANFFGVGFSANNLVFTNANVQAASLSATVNGSEADGVLDTLDIWWSNTSGAACEIYNIAIVKVS